jgi:hypothetical protein
MSPRFKYVGHSGPISSFELHTWGEGLDMPVAINLDREPPPEAIADLNEEVYILGDSFGFPPMVGISAGGLISVPAFPNGRQTGFLPCYAPSPGGPRHGA